MTKELKNRILENKVLTKDERIEIIKALEIVEEFEKAQIITGGRLNGRTYAYKCGLEDGRRKALEQQPVYIECNDIDVQKFTEDMKKQRLQVIKPNISEDCVSRQAVLDCLTATGLKKFDFILDAREKVNNLPPVTPTRKVGKWIMPDKYYDKNIWRKCSVCNTHFEKYHKYVTFSGEVTYTEEISNYCKVCGADMRGSEE